ncbi:MAG: sulfotransferase [Chloroflexota bacterium]
MKQLLRRFSSKARVFRINQKVRTKPTGFVGFQDFDLSRDGSISLETLAQNPHISLYALNHLSREAIFVETPPDVDLAERPFLYQAQYENATRLYSLSYRSFLKLAGMVRQPVKPLIFIHSVGRCGSTLLSNVFNNQPDILSLSEPDAFTGLVMQRERNGRNDAQIIQLINAIIQLQCRPTPHLNPQAYVIKFRSFSTVLIDLLHQAAPHAKHIFLYRNAEDQARSIARAFKAVEAGREALDTVALHERTKFLPLLSQYANRARQGDLSEVEMNMLGWLSGLQSYLDQHAAGVPMCAVRYEEMINQPEPIVRALFEYCRLPVTPERLALGVKAFERDSQQGSSLARTNLKQDQQNQLTAEHLAQIHQLLAEHPTIKTADFIVPNTIQPN